MKRREFIKGSLAATSMAAIGGISLNESLFAHTTTKMQMNILGKTGVKVSKLGYGCFELGRDTLTQDNVDSLMLKAIELGINYFDTAPNYNAAEERMGNLMPSIREKIFLVSKTEAHDYDGTWKLLEQSLKRLNTDRIDLMHIHNFGHKDRFKDLDFVLSNNGALGALLEAKKQGIVKFIGASGHVYPTRFHRAVDNEHIDVLMNAVNYIIRHVYNFEEKVWLRAKDKNMGLVAMKVLGGPANKNNSRMPISQHNKALRYAYSIPGISTAVIGMKTVDEIIQNVNAINMLIPLSEEEINEISLEGLKYAQTKEWKKVHGTPLT